MSAMNWIARLKSDDPPPATLFKQSARLRRILPVTRERKTEWAVDQTDLATKQPVSLTVESTHAWMRRVGRPIDELRFSHFVVTIFFCQME